MAVYLLLFFLCFHDSYYFADKYFHDRVKSRSNIGSSASHDVRKIETICVLAIIMFRRVV